MKLFPLLILSIFTIALNLRAADGGAAQKPAGLTQRVPWTTSKIHGTPDPPNPYKLVKAFSRLKFNSCTDLCAQPGSNWLVIGEQFGRAWAFWNGEDADKLFPFFNIGLPAGAQFPGTEAPRQIWSIAFHPRFWETKYVYVTYGEVYPRPRRTRISRFKVIQDTPQDPPVCDPSSETAIFEWVSAVDHHGGALAFGPDGMLYASAGDGAALGDGNISGQDITDINASIIRIDVDHPHAGQFYAIPKDNPFVSIPGARGEVWAYGLRNVWKMSFDRKTGELFAGDVGQDLWDTVSIIQKGGNYGWSVLEGTHDFRPERPHGPTPFLKPAIELDHSIARSITGGYVYRGKLLKDLVGYYVYGDYATGIVWATKIVNGTIADHKELCRTPYRIVDFCEDDNGELYVLDHQGPVYRIVPTPQNNQGGIAKGFPRKLSETGLFSDAAKNEMAPGVIPYDVNVPVWRDHAVMERYMAVPGDSRIDYRADTGWNFPEGSVIAQTVFMEMEAGNPGSRKRLETRILHKELKNWWGYTYVWNDAQTDAELLTEPKGLDKTLAVKDASAPNGVRHQTYHFPARSECLLCHTMPANYVLGLNTLQMNRDYDYNGVTENQIKALERIGMFSNKVERAHEGLNRTPFAETKMPAMDDATASLEDRARGYLHANCSHCHMKWGGGNSAFYVIYPMPLAETGIVRGTPTHGTLDLPDAKLIVPGHPESSVLLGRTRRTDAFRMPRAGSSLVDEKGVKLLEEWIKTMK
jgi:uncharacterized repeat protein (TIGR03806 family)